MTNLTRSNFQAMDFCNPRGGLIVLCLFFIFSLFLAGFFSFEFKSFLTILPSEVLYAMIGIGPPPITKPALLAAPATFFIYIYKYKYLYIYIKNSLIYLHYKNLITLIFIICKIYACEGINSGGG